MSKDIFGTMPTSVPTKNAQVVRVPFDEQELGARKSHLPKPPKNDMTIKHVTNGQGR